MGFLLILVNFFTGLFESFEILVIEFLTEIKLKMFFKFGDGFELDHDFLVVASALSGSPVSQESGEGFEDFLCSCNLTENYFLRCLDENILEWKSIKRINFRFWLSSHLPSAIYTFSPESEESF